MKQKKIEQISHDINVDVILKCLWAIRDNDQFYFNAYGKEMIEKCIEQKLKKESKLPDTAKSEKELNAVFKKSGIKLDNGSSNFILGWRKCYDWMVDSHDR
jgi:hypothetical protein